MMQAAVNAAGETLATPTSAPVNRDRQMVTELSTRILARRLSDVESQRLLQYLDSQRQAFRADLPGAEQLTKGRLAIAGSNVELAEHAAWSLVASVLLNLDEAITRE
ncbi:MAG: hypothetical protein IT423_03585 [Pirellulaceae bacterium]|nr:hypothetical protein [Pirellulaceae bacterium]